MKRLMLVAALAASSSACVANQGDAPIRFLQAAPLKTESGGCSVTTGGSQVPQGLLDISGRGTYLVGLVVETNTAQRDLSVGGKVLSGPGLNDITLNEVVLSYETSVRVQGLPEEESIPIYGVFRPGTASGSYAILPAFGSKALSALSAAVGEGQQLTVVSTIKAKGRLSSGLGVETNEIQFPVNIINSGYVPGASPACPSGLEYKPAQAIGACNQLGQDVGPICRPPSTTTTP